MVGSPASSSRIARTRDLVSIASFTIALAAPMVHAFVWPADPQEIVRRELRAPSLRPAFPTSLTEAQRFPPRFESWYDDAFGLRERLLWLRGRVLVFGFGTSPTPWVDLAPDRWMIYSDGKSREAWTGEIVFDDALLERWSAALRGRRAAIEELGAHHVFVIGPNKETIYPEHVPAGWHKVGPTPFERLRERLERDQPGYVLDLVPALRAARAEDRPAEREYLYYALGTHWLPRGDYIAYVAILNELRQRFPSIPPPVPYDELVRIPNEDDNWARRSYLEDVFEQASYALGPPHPAQYPRGTYGDGSRDIVSIGPDASLPTAMLFHDSFGRYVSALLAPHFSQLHCVWGRHVDLELVESEKPDIGLELWVERMIVNNGPDAFALDLAGMRNDPWRKAGANVLTLRRETALAQVSAGRDTSLRTPDDAESLLRIRLERKGGFVLLPPLPATTREELLVRVSIESYGATALELFPLRSGETEPSGPPAASEVIQSGRNRVLLRVRRDAGVERFALRPGAIPGRYLLRSLEIREAAP